MINYLGGASAIAIVTALITVASPTFAGEPKQNQSGAEELDQGGPIEDKYVPTQEPGPNYPADNQQLQQDAEKAKAQGEEDTIRLDQDEAGTDEDYDTGGIVTWPEDYWYWPYSLFP